LDLTILDKRGQTTRNGKRIVLRKEMTTKQSSSIKNIHELDQNLKGKKTTSQADNEGLIEEAWKKNWGRLKKTTLLLSPFEKKVTNKEMFVRGMMHLRRIINLLQMMQSNYGGKTPQMPPLEKCITLS
jgi:hypothetical protein